MRTEDATDDFRLATEEEDPAGKNVAGVMDSAAVLVALVSVVAKEAAFQVTNRIANRIGSKVLAANAWHHRSDALSSVVAMVGIGGSLLGWRSLDPLAGFVVGGMVAWMGLRISLEALAQLTDTSDYSLVEAVSSVAREVTFRLPREASAAFAKLFAQLEERRDLGKNSSSGSGGGNENTNKVVCVGGRKLLL